MSTNSPNDPFSREGAESLAHTVRQAQRAMEEHPLSAVHINQGSADAMADAYDAEYQASRTMTTPPNAPDHGCSCGRPDCQYDKAWGNPLRETQPAPDAKPNAPEVDVLAVFDDCIAKIEYHYRDTRAGAEMAQARIVVAELLTREAALVAEVDLLRRVQASMATEGVALVAERDALAAEVGALTSARDAYRTMLWQAEEDVKALREAATEWRTLGSPLVEVLVMEGMDPFVMAAHGRIATVIEDVEKTLRENPLDYFDEKGDGVYVFRANYFGGQYGEYERCELAPGWELDLLNFEPMEVAIDKASAEPGT